MQSAPTLYPLDKERRHKAEIPDNAITIHSGDYYVTDRPGDVLMTVLGSCVSACIRDPFLGVGGMNHFLLPSCATEHYRVQEDSARYGAYAMEVLINEIIKRGGQKSRLEIKVFGGANVTDSSSLIGDKNVTFIREFLKKEGFNVASEDLGDTYPRRINYYPRSGKVMMRKLLRKTDQQVVEEEKLYASALQAVATEGSIDLF